MSRTAEVDIPATGTRQLGETDCERSHPPLPAGSYRFLVPIIAEVDGAAQPGFVARRFTVQPISQREQQRLIELLSDPRTESCDAEDVVAKLIVHGAGSQTLKTLFASDKIPPALYDAMLDALERLPGAKLLLAEPLRQPESELGLLAAMRISPRVHCDANAALCDSAMAQLSAAFAEDPPDEDVVAALEDWTARWPDGILDRMVDLFGQQIDDSLRDSVGGAISRAISESEPLRSRAVALLEKRCQPPQRCASEPAREAVSSLLEEAKNGEGRGAMASIFGRDSELGRDFDGIDSHRDSACAELGKELREYRRFIEGVPLDIEMAETESALCETSSRESDIAYPEASVGCSYIRDSWSEHLKNRELRQLLADPNSLPPPDSDS